MNIHSILEELILLFKLINNKQLIIDSIELIDELGNRIIVQ